MCLFGPFFATLFLNFLIWFSRPPLVLFMSCEDACRPGPNCNEGVRLAKNGSGPNTDYLVCIAFVHCVHWAKHTTHICTGGRKMFSFVHWSDGQMVEWSDGQMVKLPNGHIGKWPDGQSFARLTWDLALIILSIFSSQFRSLPRTETEKKCWYGLQIALLRLLYLSINRQVKKI